MLHQFPSVYVDLDIEWEPRLDFYKHESVLLIQIIEIIMKAFGVHRFDNEFSAVTAIDFSSLAGFQSLQYADQAIINRVRKKKRFCFVFLPYIG